MTSRLIRCLAAAVLGGFLSFVVWFGMGIWLVRNSRDGQAGMGPAIGALFVAAPISAFVSYAIAYWQTGRKAL